MRTRKRILSMLLLIGIIVAVIVLLIRFRPPPAADTRAIPVTRVETVIVTAKSIIPSRRFSGRLEPARRATLRFEVSGSIAKINIEPGQRVKKDEVLIEIDSGDYRDRLTEAKAALAEEKRSIERDQKLLELSRENAEFARKEVDRLSRLGSKLASESTLDSARQLLTKAESESAQLQFVLDTSEQGTALRQTAVNIAQREVARTTLRAPWDGRVNQRFVEAGDYASKGTNALEMIDDSKLEAVLHVPSSLMRNLQLGKKVTVEVEGQAVEGVLTALQPDADDQTGTHPLRITLPGEGLVPGISFTTELEAGRWPNAVVVPQSAVLTDDGSSYLFVVSDNRLERRPVVLSIRDSGMQVIAEGVVADEVVVARDISALVDGLVVVVAGSNE